MMRTAEKSLSPGLFQDNAIEVKDGVPVKEEGFAGGVVSGGGGGVKVVKVPVEGVLTFPDPSWAVKR
jgi:hypothetical protein